MENKQTSIEWLQECLSIHLTHEEKMQFEGLFQQSKQMHKEEIKEGYIMALLDGDNKIRRDAEDYYNETYGKETDRS